METNTIITHKPIKVDAFTYTYRGVRICKLNSREFEFNMTAFATGLKRNKTDRSGFCPLKDCVARIDKAIANGFQVQNMMLVSPEAIAHSATFTK